MEPGGDNQWSEWGAISGVCECGKVKGERSVEMRALKKKNIEELNKYILYVYIYNIYTVSSNTPCSLFTTHHLPSQVK